MLMSNRVIWSDELLLGNKEIDADHKAFFEIALMLDCSLEHETINFDYVQFLVKSLNEYVEGHFKREEILMVSFGYTDWVRDHIEKHDFFRRIVHNVSRTALTGKRESIALLSKVCTHWFWSHIIGYDAQLKSQVGFEMVDSRSIEEILAA
ncbi:putative bacterial hemerythrin [Magnetospirillum sp. XM-1]|uniref:bacteriohemerythrin n=1 Tax=Magnetospirillum sp. XM-1 TaxID=1663591 RepID=UPI00073DC55C|nr:hemerythrin domain-containing protein [Magnetospirillum sp. XM-1]CUW40017.1 putative bacterial hemerythrin [Magnetospirillum sp. XM-1]